MNKFRHELHINSPALKHIAYCMAKDGYYYFGGTQKRKVTSYRKQDQTMVLEGEILNS